MTTLPLFPLNAVLFPDGVLGLRVFETRYLDMVTRCMQAQTPFGIALIKKGAEVSVKNKTEVAEPEAIGCVAHIIDWDMPQPGILHLRVQGGQRFEILHTEAAADGLLLGEVEYWEADPEIAIPDEYQPCVALLQRIVLDLERQHQAEEKPLPLVKPYQFNQVAWVANRLCEILTIPNKARQKLMELEEPLVRLSLVNQYLRQHKILED